MYAVQAIIIVSYPDGSQGYRALPTFYLNENVQGIVNSDHAHNLAIEIVGPERVFSVSVEKV